MPSDLSFHLWHKMGIRRARQVRIRSCEAEYTQGLYTFDARWVQKGHVHEVLAIQGSCKEAETIIE